MPVAKFNLSVFHASHDHSQNAALPPAKTGD
jgi:hypothetical protein